jgi:hypothetical protein
LKWKFVALSKTKIFLTLIFHTTSIQKTTYIMIIGHKCLLWLCDKTLSTLRPLPWKCFKAFHKKHMRKQKFDSVHQTVFSVQ